MDMSIVIEITQKYPLLTSWNDHKYWTGLVSINGELVRIAFSLPNYPSFDDASISGNEDTNTLLKQHKKAMLQILSKKNLTFVQLVDMIVELIRKSNNCENQLLKRIELVDEQYFSVLMKEIEEIGMGNVVYLSPDYRELHVKNQVNEGYEHIVKYYLPSRYPNLALKVVAELPTDLEKISWPSKIVEANQIITTLIYKYKEFWEEMEILDNATRLIEPIKPGKHHCFRRIMIQDRVIMNIELNPLHPRRFPVISLTGPKSVVDLLEQCLEKDSNKKWSEDIFLLQNLQTVMGIEFLPRDKTVEVDDDSLKCIICYMYELEGKSPERRCECGAQFHHRCLYDLFTSEFSSNMKRGVDCPVCGTELKILVVPE